MPLKIKSTSRNSCKQILKNKSIYLQILSRLALTQAAQKKFKLAHKTLDKAEEDLTPGQTLAKVRVILERGRVFLIIAIDIAKKTRDKKLKEEWLVVIFQANCIYCLNPRFAWWQNLRPSAT